jgi:hypothetical protein
MNYASPFLNNIDSINIAPVSITSIADNLSKGKSMDPIMMELVWEVINEAAAVVPTAPTGAAYPGNMVCYPLEDAGCAYPGEMVCWQSECAAGLDI